MTRLGSIAAVAIVVAACSASPASSTAPPETTSPTASTRATTLTTSTTTTAASTTVPSSSTTAIDRPLRGAVVVIDPGHNGKNAEHRDEIDRLVDIGTGTKACNTTGTQANDGYPEAQFTWDLATETRAVLDRLGATVVLTRADNEGWGPCIDRRAAIGNGSHADAVVAIHADGGPSTGRGFHVIYPETIAGLTDDIAEDSLILATDLRQAFLATGMPIADYIGTDGLSKRGDLGGLNLSDVPAVFFEAGNMKNVDDIALLEDPQFRSAAAEAIGAALVAYLSG
jgi:N-acetylmuramoyl-L-alanine amidase